MSRNIVTKSTVPPGPYDTDLVCIPIQAVPLMLGALVIKSQKYWYASPEDWHRGRKLLADAGKGMLMPCAIDIVNAIDRVHNLLDAGLNGTERSVTGTGTEADPYVYSPGLPQAPNPEVFDSPGLRADANATRQLVHNLVDGSATGLSAETRNIRQQLDELKLAIAEGEGLDPEILAKLGEIALLLA